jgi:drug/metabolite transporter (DMT)-like permease
MSQPKPTNAGDSDIAVQPVSPSAIEGADLLLLLTTLLWGVNYSVVKYAITDLVPINFVALRFSLATILMVGFMIATGRSLKVPKRDFLKLIGVGFLGNVLYQVLFVYGINLSRAGDTSIMLATAPIFTAMIGRARRLEFFGARAVVGLVLAFGGIVLLVSYAGSGGRGRGTLLGSCLLLLGAICWASYTVCMKPFAHAYGSVKATVLVMLTGTPMLVAISIPALVSQNWPSVRPASWAGVGYSGVFAIAIAYIIWSYGVHRIGPTRTAIYSNITPIATLAVAWPMLGERPRPGQILGAIVILAGVYLVRQGMTYNPAGGGPEEQEIEEESMGVGS